MSAALLLTIITDIVKYGPLVVQIIQQGVNVEQEINKANPNLLSNLATLIESLFPHLNGQQTVSSALNALTPPAKRIPSEMEGVR